jgi:hypothetical protein
MAVAFWAGVLLLGSLGTAQADSPKAAPVPMGDNTYSLTRSSGFAWALGTARLKAEARGDAEKFCADMGKRMKVVSITAEKASLIHGGYSKATIIFKAVDPAEPDMGEAPTGGGGATDLQMLIGLHDKKLLSDVEFEAARQRLDERSKDLDELLGLKRKGILTDAEFEAARSRLMEHAK